MSPGLFELWSKCLLLVHRLLCWMHVSVYISRFIDHIVIPSFSAHVIGSFAHATNLSSLLWKSHILVLFCPHRMVFFTILRSRRTGSCLALELRSFLVPVLGLFHISCDFTLHPALLIAFVNWSWVVGE